MFVSVKERWEYECIFQNRNSHVCHIGFDATEGKINTYINRATLRSYELSTGEGVGENHFYANRGRNDVAYNQGKLCVFIMSQQNMVI